jgi:3-hydroxyisobutyrate dehydrogenase-like beta-hydroxyacid dehydrogenase
MKIGFIGLGNLGTPIATNLLQNGHELHVYNRTKSKTAVLAAKGAIVAESIASLANQCRIVFSIVSDDAAIKEVTGELVQHMAADSVHVSMSTILPGTASELAALHRQYFQHYTSAPVFGRPDAAAARKLNFVVSGAAAVRKQIEPLLKDAGATGIFDFGDNPSVANTVKLCGNFLIASAMEAIGESAALASRSGVDVAFMWNMFTQTLFNCPIYTNYSSIIAQQKFEPAAFTATLGLKDMRLVQQQAAAVQVSMPLADILQQHLQQLVASGRENTDWSAVSLGSTCK